MMLKNIFKKHDTTFPELVETVKSTRHASGHYKNFKFALEVCDRRADVLEGCAARFGEANQNLVSWWRSAAELELFEKRRAENLAYFNEQMRVFLGRNPNLKAVNDPKSELYNNPRLKGVIEEEESRQWQRVPWPPRSLAESALTSLQIDGMDQIFSKIDKEETRLLSVNGNLPKTPSIIPFYQLQHTDFSPCLKIEWQP